MNITQLPKDKREKKEEEEEERKKAIERLIQQKIKRVPETIVWYYVTQENINGQGFKLVELKLPKRLYMHKNE